MPGTRVRGSFFERARGGDRHRPILLYLHGLGESGLCFESLMGHPALSQWPQVAIDMRGYGQSARTAQALSLESHAHALAAVLTARRYVLIGHSMGGVVATFLAELLDRRVAGFVNIEGNISTPDCTYSARIAACDPAEFSATGFSRLCAEVEHSGADDRALELYARSLYLADPRQLHRNATDLVAISAGESLAARMAALAMPTIYLLGSPGGSGSRTRQLLDHAGVAWSAIADAGHWPFIDQTSLCATAIASFIGRLED